MFVVLGQVPESLANEQPKQEEGENEEEEETEEKIPEDFYYDYESICSQPYITPDSGIPSGVLQLLYPSIMRMKSLFYSTGVYL